MACRSNIPLITDKYNGGVNKGDTAHKERRMNMNAILDIIANAAVIAVVVIAVLV